jgi:hypothetical protein
VRQENIVSALRDAFGEGTLEYWLCPREALEHALRSNPDGRQADLVEWQDAVATAEGDADRALDRLGVNFVNPLEGDDWWPWLRWVGSRLAEVRDDPSSLAPPLSVSYAWLRRGSSFTDESAERRAVESVLARNGDAIRAWSDAAHPTTTRLRLVADVGEEVGEATRFSDDPFDTDVVEAADSRTAAVVLGRTQVGRRFEVLGADVVDPGEGVDQAATRAAYPTLHAVLGGWFRGEDLEEPEPWYVQRTMLETEDDTVLAAVAAEGRQLLDSVDDPQLDRAVEALGCYVQPPHLRLWLTWMCWRIETFDWKPTA